MDQLYDDSKTIVGLGAFFIAFCTMLVSLRLWARWGINGLGVDDYLLLLGLCLFIVSTSFAIKSAWNGLGAHEGRYTAEQAIVAAKYFFLWEDVYVWSNIPVKVSLSLTLARLAAEPMFNYALYFIIFIICGASISTNVFLLSNCSNIVANWDPTIIGATCRSTLETVKLGTAFSAFMIFVDWTLSLMPIFMLWKVQLPFKQKVSVIILLGLGIFASSATLIRLPTLINLASLDDYLYSVAPIVIWTLVEFGIGLSATSLIAFRPLVKRLFGTMGDSSGRTPGIGYNRTGDLGDTRNKNAFVRATSRDSDIGMNDMVSAQKEGYTDSQTGIIDQEGVKVARAVQVV